MTFSRVCGFYRVLAIEMGWFLSVGLKLKSSVTWWVGHGLAILGGLS